MERAVMTVHISIHNATSIRASTSCTDASPLTLSIKTDAMLPHEVTVFIGDPVLVARLVDAINRIDQERFEEKLTVEARIANEGAAYSAADRSIQPKDDAFFEEEERGS